MSESPEFRQWAILELLGHVKVAGLVTEETHFGTALGRIDIPTAEGAVITQYFGGSSVYRLTPTTEEIARSVAARNVPAPAHRWELPEPGRTTQEQADAAMDAIEHEREAEESERGLENWGD